ncbi:MAG: hypothetical protein JST11_22665 [Acidobacteria bacterium]|nr:hypothetical protein [Acidobacteriota bacterium]
MRASTLLAVLTVMSFSAQLAKADLLFTGSQSGLCCFNVLLQQVDSDTVHVVATLTQGATYYVNSGSPPPPNHPGFAFNLAGSAQSGATMTVVNSPWTLADYHTTLTDNTGGGTFTNWVLNPGNGANLANTGPLIFNLHYNGGIAITNFVANASGNYFAADIMDKNRATGMSFISDPGVNVPDGGATVMLFGMALAVGGLVTWRRK